MLDRMLKRVVARELPDVAPPPYEIAPGLWGLDRELGFPLGMRLPTRSFLVRLDDGGVLILSAPPTLDDATTEAIVELGPVRHIVAPNCFHHVFAPALSQRYPDAALWAAPGLGDRVAGFPDAHELGAEPAAAWAGVLEQVVLQSRPGVSEVLFFHRSSNTLILTDLAFNVARYPRLVDHLVWRVSGIPRGFGPGRTSRRMLLSNRDAARECLQRLLAWPFERIVMAHGDPIEQDSRQRMRAAFATYLED